MTGPEETSIPLTIVDICPGGEILVHCEAGDGDGCDFTLLYVMIPEPAISLGVISSSPQNASSREMGISREELLTSFLQQRPLEISVDPGATSLPLFFNEAWNADKSPVSITVEVIQAHEGTMLTADVHGAEQQLVATDVNAG